MFEGGGGGGGGVPEQYTHYHHHFMIGSSSSSASASASVNPPLPLPLPLPLLPFPPPLPPQTTTAFPPTSCFDIPTIFPSDQHPHHHHHHQSLLQLQITGSHLLPQLHHPSPHDDHPTSLELERERSIPSSSWSNDEVVALLRIRSTMENWPLLPDYTNWELVSRKLADLGFRRSGEMCKQKFEEESSSSSRHLDTSMIISNYTKNYMMRPFFCSDDELEQLCIHGENSNHQVEKNQNLVAAEEDKLPDYEEDEEEEEDNQVGQRMMISSEKDEEGEEKDSMRNGTVEVVLGKSNSPDHQLENEKMPKNNKRKRHRRHRRMKFAMLKGFCEEIVNKMMAQQEKLHNKIIEDMVTREEEKVAREEAWKRQEMERINKEIEMRAEERATASDRQTKLIEFLKKFTSSSINFPHDDDPNQLSYSGKRNENLIEIPKGTTTTATATTSFSSTSSSHENPNPKCQPSNQNPSSLATQQENPKTFLPASVPNEHENVSSTKLVPQNTYNLASHNRIKEDDTIGKRWPRDEVLALIKLRSSISTTSTSLNSNEDKSVGGGGGGSAPPLWERISQGMLELGYQRSAKRCKEKWENINKYFRKTKDVNKKRSLDSRTCPYFHQLSCLYNNNNIQPEGGTTATATASATITPPA